MERLRELLSINRALASDLDCDVILRRIVQKAAEVTRAESCLLLLAGPDSLARVAASVGDLSERLEAFAAPLDERIDAAVRELLDSGAGDTFIGAPVAQDDLILGVLAVCRSGGAAAPENTGVANEEFLVSALADQAALALKQAALRELADRLRADAATVEAQLWGLLEAAPDALVILGSDRRILVVNAQTETLFGYHREELIGAPVEKLMPERFRVRHAGHLTRYFADPQVRPMGANLELKARHKNGSEFPVEISLSPLETASGLLAMGAIRDVTERKRAEEELNRHAVILREQAQLIDLAHDSIIVRDLESRIVLWNRGAEETYGFSSEEARGQVIHTLLHTRFLVSREEVNATLLQQGSWEGELTHTTRAGNPIVVASRQVLQRDEGGSPRAILEIDRDISQQKSAEKDRARLLESEQRKSEQLILVVREAHHRIKNNLQAVTDLLTLELALNAGADPGEVLRDSIERVQAIALVHELLSHEEDVESVDVRLFVEGLVPQVLRSAGLACPAVEVQVTVLPAAQPSKKATTLALILNELVSNAGKHAFAKRRAGSLQVRLTEEEGNLLLLVQDDGPGLPPRFDPVRDAHVGMQVVMMLARNDLNGRLSLRNVGGLQAAVWFPR